MTSKQDLHGGGINMAPPQTTPTGARPRLIISKLRMENFKSYGGIQEIGPFHKSFTAVIGPNGSGKSNVIDAMLFVFGRRANQIRLKKLSELIHNSSQAKDLPFCSVEVHFAYIIDDPTDKDAYSVVEGTQFFVKRVVTRNNQSQYFINKESVTSQQVVDQLKNQCQIDLDHNRFLILQGEVEQIAMMKPKTPPGSSEIGLLEYLEDIIGTSQLKPAIDQQQTITEDLTHLRQEKLQLQEKSKRELSDSHQLVDQRKQFAEQAFKYANVKYVNNLLKVHRYSDRYRQFCLFLIEVLHTVGQCEIDLKKLSRKKHKLEANNKHDLQLLNNKQLEIEKLGRRFTELDTHHTALEKKKALISSNRHTTMQRIEQQQGQLESLTRHHKDEQTRLPKIEAEIKLKEGELERLEEQLDEKVQTVSKLTEPYKQKLREINEKFGPMTAAYNEAQQALKRAEIEYNAIENKFKSGVQKKSDIIADIETVKDLIARLKNDLVQKQDKTQELVAARTSVQGRVTQVVTELKEIEARLLKINQLISGLQSQIAVLHTNNNMDDEYSIPQTMQPAQGQSSVNIQKMLPYQRLLEQKYAYNNASFQEVYGRVADVCYIDPRYEIALSNVCGDAQIVLVSTSTVAENCTKYFSDHAIGRGSFLAVNPNDTPPFLVNLRRKYQAFQQSPSSIPQGCQRLFDLIKWPEHLHPSLVEHFKVAVFKSVGDTIVCPDVKTASEIAYGNESAQRRTVAVSGEVMGVSGTMSGGRVKRGIFATTLKDCEERMQPAVFTNKQLNQQNQQNLKKRQEEDRQKDDERRAELEQLTQQLNQLQQQRSQCEYELSQKAPMKSDIIAQLQNLGARIQASERDVKETLLEISNEEETLVTHENQLKHAQTMESRQTQDKKELTDKHKVLQDLKKRVAELEQENEQAVSERNAIGQQMLAKGGNQVAAMKKELANLRDQVEELGSNKREIERNIAGHKAKYDQRKAQLDQTQSEIDAFDEQLKEIGDETEQILLEAEAVVAKKEELEEQVLGLDEKVRAVRALAQEYLATMTELNAKKNAADHEFAEVTNAVEEAQNKIKTAMKMMRTCARNANDDLEVLIDAELPPNPYTIAVRVHQARRVDYIARFVKQKEAEKKRLEREEIESGKTSGRKRAAAAATTASTADSDDEEVIGAKVEMLAWQQAGEAQFLQEFPPPQDGDEFARQYALGVEECRNRVYQRLPWYAPTPEQIASFSTRNFFAHADDPQYHHRIEDLALPNFVKFEYTVKQVKRSELSPEQLAEQLKREEEQQGGTKVEIKAEMNDDSAPATNKRGAKGRGKRGKKDGDEMTDEIPTTTTTTSTTTAAGSANSTIASQDDPELDYVVELTSNIDEIVQPITILKDSLNAFVKQTDNEEQQLSEVIQSIGEVSSEAVENYKEHQLRVASLVQYLEIITLQREEEKKKYEQLRAERTRIFMAGLHEISNQLKTLYRMLTLGGDAELELSDQNDPFLDGITFSVRPPKKSWKQIQNLSGGEKTLSSLSLVFALHYFKPTPLYVMDEIDAALDYKNVSIVANYIRERTNNNAQFIIISLRNNMFELSNRLVGIYKTNDRTKSITIDPREYIKSIMQQFQAQQHAQQQQQQQQQHQNNQNQLLTQQTKQSQSMDQRDDNEAGQEETLQSQA